MYKKYKDLERDLLSAKMDLDLEQAKLDRLIAAAGPPPYKSPQFDEPRVNSSRRVEDVNDLYIRVSELQLNVDQLTDFICRLESIKGGFESDIRKHAKRFNDLEAEVFIKHHIERQSLHSISQELNYSYDWIRKINVKISTKIKEGTEKTQSK